MAWTLKKPCTVTQYAAEVIGLGEVLGTIEVGKYGTVSQTNGDPLEVTTNVARLSLRVAD